MSTSDDLTELLHAFAGVLSEDELTEVQEFVAAHEYAFALETLCGILIEENKQMTPAQFNRIETLSERLTSVNRTYVDAVEALVSRP